MSVVLAEGLAHCVVLVPFYKPGPYLYLGDSFEYHTQDDRIRGKYVHAKPKPLRLPNLVYLSMCSHLYGLHYPPKYDPSWCKAPEDTEVTCLACAAFGAEEIRANDIEVYFNIQSKRMGR